MLEYASIRVGRQKFQNERDMLDFFDRNITESYHISMMYSSTYKQPQNKRLLVVKHTAL